jgi:hypothetical protein
VVVYLVTEHDGKSDHAEGRNPSSRDNPVEQRMRGTQFAQLNV